MTRTVPQTMQAARYHGPGAALQVETVPVPTVGGGEALIRITHAGVCRTELHFLSGLLNLGIAPLTLGHEIVGEVVLAGAAVGTVQPGDRVIVNYYLLVPPGPHARRARRGEPTPHGSAGTVPGLSSYR